MDVRTILNNNLESHQSLPLVETVRHNRLVTYKAQHAGKLHSYLPRYSIFQSLYTRSSRPQTYHSHAAHHYAVTVRSVFDFSVSYSYRTPFCMSFPGVLCHRAPTSISSTPLLFHSKLAIATFLFLTITYQYALRCW